MSSRAEAAAALVCTQSEKKSIQRDDSRSTEVMTMNSVWGSRGEPALGEGISKLLTQVTVLFYTQQNLNTMCSSEKGRPYRDGTR